MRMISEKWSLPHAVAMYQRALHGNRVLSQQGPDLTSTRFSHPTCHFVAPALLTISYVTFSHPWSSPATTRRQGPPLCLLWLYTNQSLSGHRFWTVPASLAPSSGSTWQTAATRSTPPVPALWLLLGYSTAPFSSHIYCPTPGSLWTQAKWSLHFIPLSFRCWTPLV